MLTFFTIPKAMTGVSGVHQHNAMLSWKHALAGCEVLVLGEEEGLASFCQEHQLRQIKTIERNAFGTPLLSDGFAVASRVAKHDVICYINSDIMLLPDFGVALKRVEAKWKSFLLVGQRTNVPLDEKLAFDQDWQAFLTDLCKREGKRSGVYSIDYFALPRANCPVLPSFAVGRPGWDNWFLQNAAKHGLVMVDATPSVLAVHPYHGYGHVKQGVKGTYEGPEAKANRELAGEAFIPGSLDDADYVLGKRCAWHWVFRLSNLRQKCRRKLHSMERLIAFYRRARQLGGRAE